MSQFNNREVTITHTPTGITATCNSDRSQHRNRTNALSLLKSRMWAAQNVSKPESLLASYVLHGDDQYPSDLTEFKRLHAKNLGK